jgi:4-amino-4-deoxy-L-arabinose transferase-like glycosyltransferase
LFSSDPAIQTTLIGKGRNPVMLATITPAQRGWRRALAAVVVIGVLARVAVLACGARLAEGRFDDHDNYLLLARAVATGRGFSIAGRPTAYRPPLFPMILAPVVATLGDRTAWGVAGLHLVLGACTVLLTAAAGRGFGLGPGRVLAAAAVVACDPVLVAQSRVVMTETLAAFLAAATLASLTVPGRRGAALGGVMFGLSALCRPSAWPAALLTAAARLVPGLDFAQTPTRERLYQSATLLLAAAATAAPWAVRNARVFGTPIVTTTHGGYTLALANNPVYYDEVVNGPPGAVWTGPNQALWWDAVSQAGRGLSEPEADRRLGRATVRFITTRPGDFTRASVQRLGRFWGLAPAGAVYPRPLRIGSALWTLPLWVALGLGLARRRSWRWPLVAAPLSLIGLSLVHTVYWTDLRMRAAVVPAIAVVAATAVWPGLPAFSGILTRWTGEKKSRNSVRFYCSNHGETLG